MTSYLQPDPYTCTPTSFAYLLHKQTGVDFQPTLDLLIKECYTQLQNIEKDGISFEQMSEVAKTLGISCQLSKDKPNFPAYLIGVTRLPKDEFEYTEFIDKAIKVNSLRIEKTSFVYPMGHSIAVLEKNDHYAAVFDSLFGTERTISISEFEKYLEQPVVYLSLSSRT